jgi:3-phenylpropionate/trans-cinnamate dioxygenase ferredoxin reductase subunit
LRKIVIVGASLAGLTAAEKLRELGYDDVLRLIGDEDLAPYDRPPLSKEILRGDWGIERTLLRTPDHYRDLAIDLQLKAGASALDLDRRLVTLQSGETVDYDALVIATGASPKRPAFLGGKKGIFYLRSAAESVALRQALSARPRIVVVGAGFIGMEVASAAREMGLDVTLVESQSYPLCRAIGPAFGSRFAEMLEAAGVKTRFGAGVERVQGRGSVEAVELSDGSRIDADLLLVSVGSAPNMEWLRSSGLQLNNGVICNEHCQAAENVYAVGDVASPFDKRLRSHCRSEHWTNAIEQAKIAAANILDEQQQTSFAVLPYVWSDQFSNKLQIVGSKKSDDAELIIHDKNPRRLAALYRSGNTISAVATLNWPAFLARGRAMLRENTVWHAAVEALTGNGSNGSLQV